MDLNLTPNEQKFRDEFHWSDLVDPQIGLALALFIIFIALGKWLSTKLRDK